MRGPPRAELVPAAVVFIPRDSDRPPEGRAPALSPFSLGRCQFLCARLTRSQGRAPERVPPTADHRIRVIYFAE